MYIKVWHCTNSAFFTSFQQTYWKEGGYDRHSADQENQQEGDTTNLQEELKLNDAQNEMNEQDVEQEQGEIEEICSTK